MYKAVVELQSTIVFDRMASLANHTQNTAVKPKPYICKLVMPTSF